MTKEKLKTENKMCVSVFKNEALTSEDYTSKWAELVKAKEGCKGASLAEEQER